MGFSISWVAVKGLDKALLLKRAGFTVPGIENLDEAPFSFGALPTGWAMILARDVEYGCASRTAALCKGAVGIGCQIEEHSMHSGAHCTVDGDVRWAVEHDSKKGLYNLTVRGTPPPQYDAIRERLLHIQETAVPGRLPVDYIFDVPVELAFAFTGYRHDRARFDWGEPRFTSLSPLATTG